MIQGVKVDAAGRCDHFGERWDVVAYRFPCCDGWWACHRCHDETAGHDAVPWPIDRSAEPSVRCGACGATFTAPAYQTADDRCPACGHAWNPGCRAHWPHYFGS